MKIKDIFRSDRGYRQFLLALLTIGLSYGLYKGVLDNYLAEIVGMGEFDRGVTEFFRELPGFLLVFILMALYTFSVETIFKIGGIIMLLGIVAIGLLPPSKLLVVLAIFIYSTGEHIQLGMKNTISMEYSRPGHEGEALGIQNSLSNFGNIFGFLVVIAVFSLFGGENTFRVIFLSSAAILALGMGAAMKLKGHSKGDESKRRLTFKKKFRKYYMLEIFYGARKQIFLTFGPYVLILFYKAPASVVSLLFAINALACFFLAPQVGKLIDRIGYKTIMVTDTLFLVIVCFFYGFAHRIFPFSVAFVVVCVNYVLDSVVSMASMASNVYVRDISDSQEEVMMTINTGLSVNHLISIIIALCGGYIWQTLGIEVLFTLSAVLGLVNSAYAATIKTRKQLS